MISTKSNNLITLATMLAWFVMAWLDCTGIYAQASQKGVQKLDDERQRIIKLISDGKTAQAEAEIEQILKAAPDNLEYQSLRRVLGTYFYRIGKRTEGELQYEKLIRYVMGHPQKTRRILQQVPQMVLSMSSVQQGIEPVASDLLDGTISSLGDAIEEEPTNAAFSNGLSSLIALKARLLARKERWIDVVGLYENELDRLRKRWRTDNENPENWLRLIYFLRSAAETVGDQGDYDVYSLVVERVNLLNEVIVRFPDSATLIKETFNDRLKTIKEYERASAGTATMLYETIKADIKATISKTSAKKPLYPLRISIEKSAQVFARQIAQGELSGSPIRIPKAEWMSDSRVVEADFQTGISVLIFFTPTKEALPEIGKVNEMLRTVFPDISVALFTHPLDDSFTRIQIVNRPKNVTDESKKQFKIALTDECIEARNIKYPLGILKDTMAVANRFGINLLPTACIYKNGICLEVVEGEEIFKTLAVRLSDLK